MDVLGHHEHTKGRVAHLMRVALRGGNQRQSRLMSVHQRARGREVSNHAQSVTKRSETHRLDERLVRELVQSPAERRVRQHQRPALEELDETHLDGELVGDAAARLHSGAALEGLRVDRRRLMREAIRGHQRPSYLDCGPITPNEGGNQRSSAALVP